MNAIYFCAGTMFISKDDLIYGHQSADDDDLPWCRRRHAEKDPRRNRFILGP
ncbi:hypothetical protein ACJX0J_008276, partial [Zea mays]